MQSFSNLTLDGQLPATWQLFTSTPRGRLGIDVVDADRGALVTQVMPETPADEAGIEVGDFVRSVDGVSLTDGTGSPAERLADRLREIEAGATVGLIVERAGQPLEIDVVARDAASSALRFDAPRLNLNRELGNLENQLVVLTEARGGSPGINVIRTLGFAGAPWADMELVALTEALGRYFNTSEGLLVVRAPSADAIDLQDGDVILSIGARTPNSPEHAMRILGSFEAGETIAFEIMREGSRYTSEYTVP
jgi:S1-C subfamily serine protease